MIEFYFESDFELKKSGKFAHWLSRVISSEGSYAERLNYIFCTDSYLLELNRKYLNHDTYTDILTFDYSTGKRLAGDVFISVDRVKENAIGFEVSFEEELLRVIAHGALHLLGYKDKTEAEIELMRKKENEKMKMFHVEHFDS